MTSQLPSIHEFSGVMRWPEDVERFVRQNVPDTDRVLNCPAGGSRLGDVLADADPQHDDVIPVDYRNLPFEGATFGCTIGDPIWRHEPPSWSEQAAEKALEKAAAGEWSIEEAKAYLVDRVKQSEGYYQRWKPYYELVRVTKPGGVIIFNATWWPSSKLTPDCECDYYLRADTEFADASVITIAVRQPGQKSLGEF